MSGCVFCNIVERTTEAFIIHRDEACTVFLDANPVAPGHALVVPNAHYRSMEDAPDECLAALAARCRETGMLLKRSLDAEGFNVLAANGRAAQQSVFHLHFHVIPRRSGDGIDLWFDRKHTRREAVDPLKVYRMIMEGKGLKA